MRTSRGEGANLLLRHRCHLLCLLLYDANIILKTLITRFTDLGDSWKELIISSHCINNSTTFDATNACAAMLPMHVRYK
jgi:hypothetical protein